MSHLRRISFVSLAFLLTCSQVSKVFATASSDEVDLCVFAVKSEGGELTPYGIFSKYLASRLESRHNVVVRPVSGSLSGLLAVESAAAENPPLVSVALVQADVLYHYLNGGHQTFPLGVNRSSVRSIARIFPEYIRLHQQHSESPSYTASRIYAGDFGTGSRTTAINFKTILGFNWIFSDVARDSDYRFVVTSDREPEISNRGSFFKSIFFTKNQLDIIENAFSGVYRVVPYENSDQNVIAIDAILVISKSAPPDLLDDIIQLLEELDKVADRFTASVAEYGEPLNWDSEVIEDDVIRRTYFKEIKDGERTKGIPVALHPYLRIKEVDVVSRNLVQFTSFEMLQGFFLIVLGLGLLTYLFARFQSKISFSYIPPVRELYVKYRREGLLLLLILLAHIAIPVFVWLTEFHADSSQPETELSVMGCGRAIAYIFTNVILSNNSALTFRSDLSVLWLGLLKGGYAVGGTVFGYLTVKEISRWSKTMKFNKHIIIVGWCRHAHTVVKELKRKSPDLSIVVLCNRDLKSEEQELGELNQQLFSVNTEELEAKLHKLSVERSRGVIVMADDQAARDSGNEQVDFWVAKVVCAVRGAHEKVKVVAEVSESSNVSFVKKSGADEVVCVDDFGVTLLAQALSKSGILDLFKELMNTDVDSNEIYHEKVTRQDILVTKRFSNLVRCLKPEDESRRFIVIGLHRSKLSENGVRIGGDVILNPRDASGELKEGDELIYIARTKLEISRDYVTGMKASICG